MKRKILGCLLVALCFLGASFASAVELGYFAQGITLPNAPDYEWWYGCSPTSAGMMMGYYDINGYGGLSYDNLVAGGTAELSNYGNPGALANDAIASSGHIADFWVDYGKSGLVDPSNANYGPDPLEENHSFDSLADFMGTSQDSVGNVDGGTTFFFYANGGQTYAADLYAAGIGYWDHDGMYGMSEYFDYAGYGSGNPANNNFYTQLTDNVGATYGFGFDDYVAEIDAGGVVMIHVEGHSMFGYGYDVQINEVILHDTWSEGEQSMAWGEDYSGLDMWGVTVFTPTGGSAPVPEPATMVLLGFGLLGLACFRKRFRR